MGGEGPGGEGGGGGLHMKSSSGWVIIEFLNFLHEEEEQQVRLTWAAERAKSLQAVGEAWQAREVRTLGVGALVGEGLAAGGLAAGG